MDILICQSCGIILRGKSKFCTGCGTTISKFSPTALPVIAHTAAPLAVTLDPDPLALERALNRQQYGAAVAEPFAGVSSYLQSGGNEQRLTTGGNGTGQSATYTPDPSQQGEPDYSAQTSELSSGEAAQVSTSKLQNILGNAAGKTAPAAGMSHLISLDAEENGADPAASVAAESPIQQQTFEAAQAPYYPEQAPIDVASNPAADDTPPVQAAISPALAAPSQPSVAEMAASSPASFGDAGMAVGSSAAVGAGFGAATATPMAVAAPIAPPEPPVVPAPQPSVVSQNAPPAQAAPPTFFGQAAPASPISPQESPTAEPQPEPANLIMPPGGVVTTGDTGPSLFDATPATSEVGTQPLAEPPVVAQPEPAPVAAAPTVQTPQSTSFFGGGGNSFDFFSSGSSAPAVQSAPSSSSNDNKAGSPPTFETAATEPDIPDGVPSVIAAAMRAAANNTSIEPDGTSASAKTEDRNDDGFPDESANRGKKKPKLVEDDADSDEKETKRSPRKFSGDKDDDSSDKSALATPSFSFPIKQIGIGVVALVFVCFIGGKIMGAIGSMFGGGAPKTYFSGQWKIATQMTGTQSVHAGMMDIVCNGNQFSGQGVDDYAPFVVGNGIISGKKVQFVKQYKNQSKPINFIGEIDFTNPDFGKNDIPYYTHMAGMWQVKYRSGAGWRGTIVEKNGKWESGLIRVGTDDPGRKISQIPGGNSGGGGIIPAAGSRPEVWARFFGFVALGLLGIGMLIVFASVRLFGPSGLLNIWAKKEYIPSQFKSQHFKMVREFGKPARPGGLPLGHRADWNLMNFYLPQQLAIPPEHRAQNPHMLVLGAGSKGKSRLLASMIAHDIQGNDRAVVVIDSDGALIDLLMAWVAAHPKGAEYAKRMIVIDPTHGGETLAYNPLEFPDDGDLQNAASSVVFGFKAIYTEPPGSQSQWNQQTANILRNSAILLMANGKTLTDLPVLLSENDFRDVLLEKIERQKHEKAEFTTLIEAWSQYKRLARTDQWINWVEPILNRVQPMLGDPRIRPILTKAKGDLNLKEIINEGKILFVKVPQGQLDQNANLLGSLIVTGLKQAALSLSLKASSRKHPCALYLDEFDNFIEKETFDAITSETKKFQIGFIGASKTLQGIPEDYRNQIIINVGTMCCFALAKKDGDLLGPQMFRVDGRKVKHQTLQNIFNKVNTAPQFELISDEEKLNIDRVVGQEERTFFCYRVGTIAGVFQMKALDFKDIPDKDINWTLVDKIYARSVPKE